MDVARGIGESPQPPGRRAWLAPVCLAIICLVIYEPGRFENTSGDNISLRYWPVSILKYHTLTLDPFKQDLSGVAYAAIYMGDGRWLPRTNWGLLPLVLPVYLAADAFDVFGREWTHDRISRVARSTGILLATAAVVLLYRFLLKLVPPGAAFLSALLFATGTWQWSIGAQGAGLQVAAVLILTLNLHALWRFCDARSPRDVATSAVLLGALHAWLWSVRPQDLYLLVPVGLLVLERRALVPYMAAFGTGVALTSGIYRSFYGNWLGFYGVVVPKEMTVYRWNPLSGAAGLLFSPNRGLIVFLPLALLLPYLWWKLMPAPSLLPAVRRAISGRFDERVSTRQRVSLVLAIGCGLYFLSIASLDFWQGGWAYGPRYLYDFVPCLWPPIALAIADLLRWVRGQKPLLAAPALTLVALFSLQSVLIHGLGHLNYDLYIWNFDHQGHSDNPLAPMSDRVTWDTQDWIIADTWKAGSNLNRWPDALQRLRDYGF